MCFYRALSSASVRTATRESSARNSMPATTDLVATMAPAPTLDRGVKDTISHAPALQVCVCACPCGHHVFLHGLRPLDVFISGLSVLLYKAS